MHRMDELVGRVLGCSIARLLDCSLARPLPSLTTANGSITRDLFRASRNFRGPFQRVGGTGHEIWNAPRDLPLARLSSSSSSSRRGCHPIHQCVPNPHPDCFDSCRIEPPPPVLLFLFPFPFPLLSFSPSFSFSSLFLFSSALRCTRNGDARLSKKQLELYFSFSLFRLFFLFPPHAPRLERNKSCRCYVRRRREKGHMSNNGLVAQRRTEKWESIKVMRIFLRTIADRVRISRFAFARILTGTSSRAPSTLYRIG